MAPAERSFYGGVAELMRCTADRVVIEGPAGTGKTSGALHKLLWLCEEYPGCRILVLRRTRKSLNDTVLVELETVVLGRGHPMISGTAKRSHRDSYVHPNGAELVLGGTDHPERYMSGQYDVIYVAEATETLPEQIETVMTRLRNGVLPYQQLILDCNPDRKSHWINRRANQGWLHRILSRHYDNPRLFDHATKSWTEFGYKYLRNVLGNLTGPRRARLLLGQWVTAEGLIWEPYDPAKHLITGEVETDDRQRRWIRPGDIQVDDKGNALPRPRIRVRQVIAGLDFGHQAPGSIQVLAVGEDDVRYRVAEAYHAGKLVDWWAERIAEIKALYSLDRVFCDPENSEAIERLNALLGYRGKRDIGRLCVEANNRVVTRKKGDLGGLDAVREGFSRNKLILFRDVMLGGIDIEQRTNHRPWNLAEELDGYVWEEYDEGETAPERPKDGVPDHACDGLRYAYMGTLTLDSADVQSDPLPSYRPGTYGEIFGSPAQLEATRLERERFGKYGW